MYFIYGNLDKNLEVTKMILVIASIKGGVGKSCIATNIAVCLQSQGHKVKLIDGDKQGTTTEWVEERRELGQLPDIRFAQYTGNCREDLLADERDGYTVVVDTGGHDSPMMRSALTAATHLLIPSRTKRRDLKTLIQMMQLIDEVKVVNPDLIVRGVATQCPTLPSLGYRIQNAKDAFTAFGIPPLQYIINNREIYDDADEDGSSVFEFEPKNDKAIAEMTNIVNELMEAK